MRTRQIAVGMLMLAAVALVPWTLWLTYTLPSRHVTHHYDLAWVGFDCVLAVAIGLTACAALRGWRTLVPLAAVTGTLLLSDAWFDVVTSAGGGELLEAILLAAVAELPLAALCALLVVLEQTKPVLELRDP